jgi:hypothetical protein
MYYIVELLRQTDVSGPYVFGLSAFSNVLYSFGGGPGQIGLHGTDDPSALGKDVSNGLHSGEQFDYYSTCRASTVGDAGGDHTSGGRGAVAMHERKPD